MLVESDGRLAGMVSGATRVGEYAGVLFSARRGGVESGWVGRGVGIVDGIMVVRREDLDVFEGSTSS